MKSALLNMRKWVTLMVDNSVNTHTYGIPYEQASLEQLCVLIKYTLI